VTNPLSNYRSLWLPDLLWILLLAALATIPFLTPALDIRILSWFYHPGAQPAWPHESSPVWRALYTFGTWPALITALAGLALVVMASYRPRLIRWRRHAALVFLTLVLGPGLFVNTLFKDHWGRPRPRQVTELGGTMTYQCFYEKGVAGRGKSFPCGHSSMGYYFVVFYFLTRRKHRRLARIIFAGTLAYGTWIGIARMMAGAHFASDVLWSAVFPSAMAWLLYYVILRIPQYEDTPAGEPGTSFWRSRILLWGAPPVAAAAIGAVMLATPAYTEIRYDLVPPHPGPAIVNVHAEKCRVSFITGTPRDSGITIRGEAQGFGWPWSRLRHQAVWRPGPGAVLDFTFKPAGHFSELDGEIIITTPEGTVIHQEAR
jgi:lipid A 4'-phosphatase